MPADRVTIFLVITLFLVLYGTRSASGCHAGYSHGSEPETEEEGLIVYFEEEENETESVSRSKRAIEEFKNLTVLRDYFRDCMTDKAGLIWDWKSVVDYSILDTIWFFYSYTVACLEEKGRDTVGCWQTCIEVYLRDNSTLVNPAKECVAEYAADYLIRNPLYRNSKQPNYVTVVKNVTTEYGKCVKVISVEEDSILFDESGVIPGTEQDGKDISSILRFIKRDVKCRVCDYGFLPGTDTKPSFAENLNPGNPDRRVLFSDGGADYIITWPFSFEAMTRWDSSLRNAASFCNTEFAPTFVKDPPPNLGWAEWVSWGKCYAACADSGFRQRIRVCLDDTRENCIGNSIQTEECFNSNCAHWAGWGTWTPCHSTCGISIQMSFRKCKNGDYAKLACLGEFKRTRSCVVEACPIPWSQWSGCSVTCGSGGIQRRSGGESLLKIVQQTRSCFPRECPGVWSSWSKWGQCSVSCGGGTKKRVRSCEGGTQCVGKVTDYMKCRFVYCPDPKTATNWGEWSDWSDCTWKRRTRICAGGSSCEGDANDFQQCYGTDCPIFRATPYTPSVEWTQWSRWTKCSATCGQGKVHRYRKCMGMKKDIPTSCLGRREEFQDCMSPPCRMSHHRCFDDIGWLKLCQQGYYICGTMAAEMHCRKTCKLC